MTLHVESPTSPIQDRRFPAAAGVFLGLGLGGFFDGIILHQVLQWHHIASSAGYPPDTLVNLKFNVMLDGLFHLSTYAFTGIGLVILWRAARKPHFWWSPGCLFAAMLVGFGAFNVIEGTVNHHLLGLHHVNETVDRTQWIFWDIGFLAWGVLMFLSGCFWLARIRNRAQGS